MDVVVAGGHGKVGQRLLRLLAQRGDRARGLIRNPDHAADLEALGAELPYGQVTRDDVAAVLLALLDTPNTIGKAFVVLDGETPVDEAVREL